jgi:sulfur-oxidizing protein SoxY
VLRQALGGQNWEPSPDVLIQVPPLAENGAIVPITVESRLPGTRRLLILAGNNPGPLLAEFRFEPGADPWVSLRLKLNASGPVLAIAEASGRFHGAEVPVKVMVGGCG